eukprot:TRINITY_DN12610_c0_g2_i2.p1 TRINITY_DN12610_c0_g2~~TRINITY_DN12610_c0_g2_i2.p1  ORF type:complete len:1525 (+),score=256.39 TRINITY_DN12610_c0_g2_i2:240-4577(+)
MPVVSASDQVDGIVQAVGNSSHVNIDVVGVYNVDYHATDSSNNTAYITLPVVVTLATSPRIFFQGPMLIKHEAALPFSDPGAYVESAAGTRLTIALVTQPSSINVRQLGLQELCYQMVAADAQGNRATPVCRDVVVVDTTPPVINDAALYYHEARTPWRNPLVDATDLLDGNVSSRAIAFGQVAVDADLGSRFSITYQVSDLSDNEATFVRTVELVDTLPPTIELTGPLIIAHEAGTLFTDPGYNATDLVDGEVTVATDASDINRIAQLPFEAAVYYTAQDNQGNRKEINRTVIVQDTQPPSITFELGNTSTVEAGQALPRPSFVVKDTFEGDLTSRAQVFMPALPTPPFVTPMTLTAEVVTIDGSDNNATAIFTYTIVDTTAPTLDVSDTTFQVGSLRFYNDGAYASDVVSGNLTASINTTVLSVTPAARVLPEAAVCAYSSAAEFVPLPGAYSPPSPRVVAGLFDADLPARSEVVLKHNVHDAAGNHASQTQEISFVHDRPPICHHGGNVTLNYQRNATFMDSVNCSDMQDGDLSSFVCITVYQRLYNGTEPYSRAVNASYEPVVTGGYELVALNSTPGTKFDIEYTVVNSMEVEMTTRRSIVIVDNEPPKLNLLGSKLFVVPFGTVYREPGFSVTDNYDDDLTGQVLITGAVDVNSPGNYEIVYRVGDTHGNNATARRVVVVNNERFPDDKVYQLVIATDSADGALEQLLDLLNASLPHFWFGVLQPEDEFVLAARDRDTLEWIPSLQMTEQVERILGPTEYRIASTSASRGEQASWSIPVGAVAGLLVILIVCVIIIKRRRLAGVKAVKFGSDVHQHTNPVYSSNRAARSLQSIPIDLTPNEQNADGLGTYNQAELRTDAADQPRYDQLEDGQPLLQPHGYASPMFEEPAMQATSGLVTQYGVEATYSAIYDPSLYGQVEYSNASSKVESSQAAADADEEMYSSIDVVSSEPRLPRAYATAPLTNPSIQSEQVTYDNTGQEPSAGVDVVYDVLPGAGSTNSRDTSVSLTRSSGRSEQVTYDNPGQKPSVDGDAVYQALPGAGPETTIRDVTAPPTRPPFESEHVTYVNTEQAPSTGVDDVYQVLPGAGPEMDSLNIAALLTRPSFEPEEVTYYNTSQEPSTGVEAFYESLPGAGPEIKPRDTAALQEPPSTHPTKASSDRPNPDPCIGFGDEVLSGSIPTDGTTPDNAGEDLCIGFGDEYEVLADADPTRIVSQTLSDGYLVPQTLTQTDAAAPSLPPRQPASDPVLPARSVGLHTNSSYSSHVLPQRSAIEGQNAPAKDQAPALPQRTASPGAPMAPTAASVKVADAKTASEASASRSLYGSPGDEIYGFVEDTGPVEIQVLPINRSEAEDKLSEYLRMDGAYLLRKRRDASTTALSMVYHGRVEHHLLRWRSKGGYTLNDIPLIDCNSLADCIALLSKAVIAKTNVRCALVAHVQDSAV